jgi:hypothetical protein
VCNPTSDPCVDSTADTCTHGLTRASSRISALYSSPTSLIGLSKVGGATHTFDSIRAIQVREGSKSTDFGRRFDYSATGHCTAGLRIDFDALSSGELAEYQTLIANPMNRADWTLKRLWIFCNQRRATLDGAQDEKELNAGMRHRCSGRSQPSDP